MSNYGLAGDNAGSTVSLSGNVAVIGVPLEDSSSDTNSGGVDVYQRSGTAWTYSHLSPTLHASSDLFGRAAVGSDWGAQGFYVFVGAPGADIGTSADVGKVFAYVLGQPSESTLFTQTLGLGAGAAFGSALSADGGLLAVGAPGAGSPASGRVYLFSTLILAATLVPSDGATNDQFGGAVAAKSSTVLVGASNAMSARGAAYAYVASAPPVITWSEQAKLVAADGALGDRFGSAIALDGDTAMVGADNAAIGGNTYEGAVYVFQRTGSVWSQTQKLIASDGVGDGHFGRAVSLRGDRAVFGAFNAAGLPQGQGAAYVFQRVGSSWTEVGRMVANDGVTYDNFGQSVSLDNGQLLVGAIGVDGVPVVFPVANTKVDQGASYLFDLGASNGEQCAASSECLSQHCVAQQCCPTSCDDGNDCTVDSCAGGTCTHTALANGTSCADANLCNGNETCSNGVCAPGATLDCDDGNLCTDDQCAPTVGCQHVNNHAPCSDGSACTTNDVCSAGACSGVPVVCDDNNACTLDSCDPAVGCKNLDVVDGTLCDDGNACSTASACESGLCVGTSGLNCADSNPCTQDGCNNGACDHPKLPAGTVCSDANACTESDVCSAAGVCAGTPKNCDDADPCTVDSCDPSVGCQHTLSAGGCSDGNPCTTNDSCSVDNCEGTPLTCAPVDECHVAGTCDAVSGGCGAGTPKPNGAPCTLGTCEGGVCTSQSSGSGGQGGSGGSAPSTTVGTGGAAETNVTATSVSSGQSTGSGGGGSSTSNGCEVALGTTPDGKWLILFVATACLAAQRRRCERCYAQNPNRSPVKQT